MQLEFHQLDRRWEHLRVRHAARQRRLLASLAEVGQQTPIVVVAAEGLIGLKLVGIGLLGAGVMLAGGYWFIAKRGVLRWIGLVLASYAARSAT